MKLEDLKNLVLHPICDMSCELVIKVEKPSIGPLATVPVKSIGPGIDWDNGKVIIWPAAPLAPKAPKEMLYDMSYDFMFRCACGRNKSLAEEAKRLMITAGYDPVLLEERIKGMS